MLWMFPTEMLGEVFEIMCFAFTIVAALGSILLKMRF